MTVWVTCVCKLVLCLYLFRLMISLELHANNKEDQSADLYKHVMK